MVRTYAYNPSTQSASLPGSRLPPPELGNNNAQQQTPIRTQPERQYRSDATMPFMHQVFAPEATNLDASLSSGSSLENAPPEIVAGNTQLFGIRSVLINGQQFYQPLDSHFNMLINKEFASLGIFNNPTLRNNNDIPPSDPTPGNFRPEMMGQSQFMGFQPAGQVYPGFPLSSAMFHASTGNVDYQNFGKQQLSQNNLRRSDSVKAFSEFEPVIQRNRVGVSMNTLTPMDSYASSSIPSQDNEKLMINDLPWARGNPQPKSGKRGSYHWKAAQQSAASIPAPFQSNSYNGSTNRSMYAPPLASNLYNFEKDPYASVNYNPPLPVHLPSLNMNSTTNGYGAFYNDPFVAARNSYNPGFPTNAPTRSMSYDPPTPVRNDKEQHKLDLLQQIEENKRRKQMEQQREREIEERERYRSELFQARQQAEIDQETRKQKLKALAAERKAEHIASLNANRFKKPSRSNSSSSISRKSSSGRPQSNEMSGPARKLEWWEKKNPFATRSESPMVPALRNRLNSEVPQSPVIPTLRNRQADTETESPLPAQRRPSRESSGDTRNRTETPQSRRSKSHAPRRFSNSNERVDSPKPIVRPESRPIRPAAMYQQRQVENDDEEHDPRNDDDLRRFDVTAQELEDEQQRVSSALRRNNYDSHVFS